MLNEQSPGLRCSPRKFWRNSYGLLHGGLPVSREKIPKRDVNRWPHLKGVTIPQFEAEIALLIVGDVPQL